MKSRHMIIILSLFAVTSQIVAACMRPSNPAPLLTATPGATAPLLATPSITFSILPTQIPGSTSTSSKQTNLLISDWLSVITSLGSLLVAAFALWLSFTSRSSTYRETLYQKQIEIFTELLTAFNSFYDSCVASIKKHDFPLDDDARSQIQSELSDLAKSFHREYVKKWLLFIPFFLDNEILDFIRVLNEIGESDKISTQYAQDPIRYLTRAYARVHSSARQGLGIESLSGESLRLFGGEKLSEKERLLSQERFDKSLVNKLIGRIRSL